MPDRPRAKEPTAILAPVPVLALVAFAAGGLPPDSAR